jgi:hypothetical protein
VSSDFVRRLSAAGSLNVPPRDDRWLDDEERDDEERVDDERLDEERDDEERVDFFA